MKRQKPTMFESISWFFFTFTIFSIISPHRETTVILILNIILYIFHIILQRRFYNDTAVTLLSQPGDQQVREADADLCFTQQDMKTYRFNMSTCTTPKHVLRWPGQNTCTTDTAGLIPAERTRRTRCFCWDYFQRWINPHVAAGRWTRDGVGHWHVWIVSGRRCSSETSEADRSLLVWELFMSTGKYKLQVKPVTADVWSLITLVYFIF